MPQRPYILIIDDDEDDRDMLSSAIHDIDPQFKCLLAANGDEALTGLRLNHFPKPELIFLDLNMPRLTGLQLLKELKKDRVLQEIPVVIYSTSNAREDKAACMELGAVHFITKPTSYKVLKRMISDVLVTELLIR